MAFDQFTSSLRNGRPIELYIFTFGPSNLDVRRYTDAEFPVVLDGETYSPVPIERSIINNAGTLDKTSFEISMPLSLDIPQLYRIYPPAKEVAVMILQGEAEDSEEEYVPLWFGRVLSCAYEGLEGRVACEPISTSFSRVGLRRNYQYMCPHMLYGPRCKASKLAASTAKVVHAITGRDLTLTDALVNPNSYVGGNVDWPNAAGIQESRTILAITEVSGRSVLRLTGITRDLDPGDGLTLVLGCKHTEESCVADHDNILEYGGMPWIPQANPIGAVSPYQ